MWVLTPQQKTKASVHNKQNLIEMHCFSLTAEQQASMCYEGQLQTRVLMIKKRVEKILKI